MATNNLIRITSSKPSIELLPTTDLQADSLSPASINPLPSSEPLAQHTPNSSLASIPTDPRDLAKEIAEQASSLPLTNQEKILFAATLLNGAVSLLAASGWTSEQASVFLTTTTDHLFGICQWGFILANANIETAKALLFSGMIETVGRFYPSLRLLLQTGSAYAIAQRAFQGIKSSWAQHQTQGWKAWISSGVRLINTVGSCLAIRRTARELFSEKLVPCFPEDAPTQCSISEKPIWKIYNDLLSKANQGELGKKNQLALEDFSLGNEEPLRQLQVLTYATQAQISASYEQWVQTMPESCSTYCTFELFQALQKTLLSTEQLFENGPNLKNLPLNKLDTTVKKCENTYDINYKIDKTRLILHRQLYTIQGSISDEKLEEITSKYRTSSLDQLKEPLRKSLLQLNSLTDQGHSIEEIVEKKLLDDSFKESLSETLAILYSPAFSDLGLQILPQIRPPESHEEFFARKDTIDILYISRIESFFSINVNFFLFKCFSGKKIILDSILKNLPRSVATFAQLHIPSLSFEEFYSVINQYKETDLQNLQEPFQKLLSQWSSISDSFSSEIEPDFLKNLLSIVSCPAFIALSYRTDPIPFSEFQQTTQRIHQETQIGILHKIWIAQMCAQLAE